MVTYYVTIKVEQTLVIDTAMSEDEAVKMAFEQFDSTALDPELEEVWSDEDED